MSVCFLFNVEGTIVSVAIPRISQDLGLSSVESALLASLYYIGMTLALAPVSVLASRFCVKRMLVVSLVVFTVGAFAAWIAPNSALLLAARVLQGIGGGGMAAMAYGSVGLWFETKRVGWAYGWVNSAIGAGMLLGAPLGGALIAFDDWMAIFSVTGCVSIAVLVLCATVLPAAFHVPVSDPFVPRLLRSFLLGFGIAGTVFAISKVGGVGLGARDVQWSGGVGLAALAVTVLLEWRSEKPLIPREVWRGGRAALALVVVSCGRGLLIVSNFTVPFLMGVVFGFRPAAIGGCMAISAGLFALSGPRSAALAQRIGPARLVSRAMLVVLAAYVLLGVVAASPAVPTVTVALGLALVGLGTGFVVTSASKAAVDSVPATARGSLAMLLPTAGFVGMACHVTCVEWIFAWQIDGGFRVVEHAAEGSMFDTARPGFTWVFGAAAAMALLASMLAWHLSKMEQAAAEVRA